MRNIFDTHSHYGDRAFDDDRAEVLAGLPGKGVRCAVLVSCSVKDTENNIRLAGGYDWIYTTAGFHPEYASDAEEGCVSELRKLALSSPDVRAIGEIGLDYHYEGYDREKQIKLFCDQLELAKELSLPVIIHSRDAAEDTMRILREYRPEGVMLCFSYSAEIAKEVIKLGMYIGFTGVITFRNAKKALKALAEVPDDRLLLETDCPYMAPEPYRGRRCDSSMIAHTAARAAELRGMDTQALLDMTCRNGMRFYGIEEKSGAENNHEEKL